jgi:hypothetical protein
MLLSWFENNLLIRIWSNQAAFVKIFRPLSLASRKRYVIIQDDVGQNSFDLHACKETARTCRLAEAKGNALWTDGRKLMAIGFCLCRCSFLKEAKTVEFFGIGENLRVTRDRDAGHCDVGSSR